MNAMELELIVRNESTEDRAGEFPFDRDALAKEVCRKVLQQECCPMDCQVSLTYVGDEQIQNINREYREMDRVTDVLSFPNLPFEGAKGPLGWELLEDSMVRLESVDPDTGMLCLGDIVLNLNRVLSQAKEYGHTVRREFAFLIAHSMLHLCGYDHMTEQDSERMFGLQERILEELQIPRDL
jgi:probable rRNA maturation factor